MWEKYYSAVHQLPRRLTEPVPLVVELLPTLRRRTPGIALDLGCGTGRHCVYLARNKFDVIGVDTSETALRMANRWVRKERLSSVTFVRGTIASLPFGKNRFDAVIGISVIHHAMKKDILKTIAEIYRTLKKGGIFFANLISVKDPRYGTGQQVEKNTFRIPEAFEERRFEELHHFFTKKDVSGLLSRFAETRIELLREKPYYWKATCIK